MAEKPRPFGTQPQSDLFALQAGARTASISQPSPIDLNGCARFYNPRLYVPYPNGSDNRDSSYTWMNPPHLIGPLEVWFILYFSRIWYTSSLNTELTICVLAPDDWLVNSFLGRL